MDEYIHSFDNDGWTDYEHTADPTEFGAVEDDSQPSSYGWVFPDGSELWCIPGQKTTTYRVIEDTQESETFPKVIGKIDLDGDNSNDKSIDTDTFEDNLYPEDYPEEPFDALEANMRALENMRWDQATEIEDNKDITAHIYK